MTLSPLRAVCALSARCRALSCAVVRCLRAVGFLAVNFGGPGLCEIHSARKDATGQTCSLHGSLSFVISGKLLPVSNRHNHHLVESCGPAVRPLGPAPLSVYARGAGAQDTRWDARCLRRFAFCAFGRPALWPVRPFGPCVPWALRPFLRTPAGRVRRTPPGTLGAFSPGASPAPCVPFCVRPRGGCAGHPLGRSVPPGGRVVRLENSFLQK